MDPLSITTGCITLITVVGSCARGVTEFAVSCRDARQDLAAMSHELSDLDMTLHILKDDTVPSGPNQLPENLRRRICDVMENCNGVLAQLKALLKTFDGARLDRAARWAISGRKDAEKIRSSLKAHKGALSLVVEATTLHMTMAAVTNTKKVSSDTSLIKEYTMKIVEQLAKQDEILEQIAWIRAAVSQRNPSSDHEITLTMNRYLDSITDYTESVSGDSVTDEVANEMRRLSWDSHGDNDDSSTQLVDPPEEAYKSLLDETPESMTIVLGNTHRLIIPHPGREYNEHLWSFYLQASGEEVIQDVKIFLHRTFRPQDITLKSSPYRVTRIGWGRFTIYVDVVLKPGYLWDRSDSKALRLEWDLDFDGHGSSFSNEYGVKIVGDGG